MEGELKRIKKLYGENFAKLCRTLFSRILDNEGKLLEILLQNFAPTHSLYRELVSQDKVFEFKGFIFSKAGISTPERKDIDKTPEELLAGVGYKLYKCKNDREVKSFKKYYDKDELLCTFRDSNRVKTQDVFFVVREDVDSIIREDFKNPQREDRYGTSVMSLQFDKEDSSLSIKNRYNHTVQNPDATYGNDLDCIVPGLTDSFAKYYELDSRVNYSHYPRLNLAHFVQDKNGVAYRYNSLVRGVFYCENNIVVKNDGTAVQYDKSKYELVSTFLIDKAAKTMVDLSGNNDTFVKLFVDVDKIDVEKGDGETKKIIVSKNNGEYFTITVNSTNSIIHYENNFQTEVEDGFLQNNTSLEGVTLPKAKKIGKNFLYSNMKLKTISFPELEEVGNDFLRQSSHLTTVDLPKLKKVGENFLYNAVELKTISLPSLEEAGDVFLAYASVLEFAELPKLRVAGESSLRQCVNLRSIDLPKLEVVGDCFLRENHILKQINVPTLREIGNEFLFANKDLRSIDLPSAETIGNNFMFYNEHLSSITLPVLKNIDDKFLCQNTALRRIDLPMVEIIGKSFLYGNKKLKSFNAPKLKQMDSFALYNNRELTRFEVPHLEILGTWGLHKNSRLKAFDVPKIRSIGECSLTSVGRMKKIRVSNRNVLAPYIKAKKVDVVGGVLFQPEN